MTDFAYRCETRDKDRHRCKLNAGHAGPHEPEVRQVSFAQVALGLIALGIVLFVAWTLVRNSLAF